MQTLIHLWEWAADAAERFCTGLVNALITVRIGQDIALIGGAVAFVVLWTISALIPLMR